MLYVVDSVTRQWLEQARKAGQTLGSSASDGTFAAGVNRVTELLPAFMNDIISTAPEEQKVRFLEMLVNNIVTLEYMAVDGEQDRSVFLLPTLPKKISAYSVCVVFQNSRILCLLGQDKETY